MRFRPNWLVSALASSFLPAMIGACHDAATPAHHLAAGIESEGDTDKATYEAAHQVIESMASALTDAEVRAELRDALRASSHTEGKLHFQSYLRTGGEALRTAIAERSGMTATELLHLADRLGSTELYFPVSEHRDSWDGEKDMIVAFQLDEEEPPTGIHLDGTEAELTLDGPPPVPVLMIVPAESFEDDGTPTWRTSKELSTHDAPPPPASYSGLWVTYSHLGNLHEPWTRGKPEIEMHLQNGQTRDTIRCVEEDDSVEPYRFNQDKKTYTNDFLLARSAEIPQGVPLLLVVYEDDDKRCVIKDKKDYVGLTAQAARDAFDAFNSFRRDPANPGWVLDAVDAIAAVISILKGGDDYVGSALAAPVAWTGETEVTLSNQQLVATGLLRLQLKTDVAH